MLRDKNLVLAGPCSHLSVEKEWYSLKVTFSSSHVRKKTLILWHRKGESKKNYLLPFTATKEVLKLAMFQYKITHNILATNSILYKMKKVASPSCPFCPSDCQNMYHLFISCPQASSFWHKFQRWYSTVCNANLILSEPEILFWNYSFLYSSFDPQPPHNARQILYLYQRAK